MDDAELVAAALAGDRNAFAAIYDRYADRIHDFCASILRNRADASSALQETFLIAFEVLDQLVEPARLGPWLYAIAHRTVLDHVANQAPDLGEEAHDLIRGSGAADERLSRAEMAEFVWQASAGLSERDRSLLDLHLRQGLDGRDLASAAGVPGAQIDTRLEALEAQVDRSLGALLVARTSQRSCPTLSGLLSGWDGRLTPEFRDRVTAHVDDCEVCNSRRRIAPSPLALLGATPLAPAAAYLRNVVVGKAELEAVEREGERAPARVAASAGWAFTRDGFPDLSGSGGYRAFRSDPGRGGGAGYRPEPRTAPVFASTRPMPDYAAPPPATVGRSPAARGSAARAPTAYLPAVEPERRGPPPDDRDGFRDRLGMLVGGLTGLIILIAAVVIVLQSRSPSKGSVGVGVTTSSSITQTSATTTSTAPAVIAPSTVAPTTTTVAINGHLIVGGSKTLNFGTTATTASVTVGNDGQALLSFTATAVGTGLTVNPVAGTIMANANQPLMVSLDRTQAPPGPFTGTIQIASAGGNTTLNVTALIDPGPMISPPTPSAYTVYVIPCKTHLTGTTATVTATVTGAQPVTEVVLHWQSTVAGDTGTASMTSTGSSLYTGVMGPFPHPGSVAWWVTAIDNANATSTTGQQPLTVAPCA